MGVGELVKAGQEITAEKMNKKLEYVEASDIVTGAITVDTLAVHLGEVGPIPDTATWYSFPYTLSDTPRQAIVTPTTGGVEGYVMVNNMATTGIELVASVSGVKAIVSVLL